ncbi:pantetheine-phosphate adenylyltransferase [Acidaminobacterium chupaoyuni]
MTLAIVPGSFDPVTYGHLDIVRRASKLFDKVIVLAMVNEAKQTFFSPEERLMMLRESVKGMPGVAADFFGGMTYDYIRDHGVDVIVKGVRNPKDFEYEAQIALFNQEHAPMAETMFFYADPKLKGISSSAAKQAFAAGQDITDKVPPIVLEMLRMKQEQLK